MKRIYKNKTKLRILIDTRCDLTGYAEVTLCDRKPDCSEVRFDAVVKDSENGIIFFDVKSEADLDMVGWWTFWPEVTFDDDRTACGRTCKVFVYESGR